MQNKTIVASTESGVSVLKCLQQDRVWMINHYSTMQNISMCLTVFRQLIYFPQVYPVARYTCTPDTSFDRPMGSTTDRLFNLLYTLSFFE